MANVDSSLASKPCLQFDADAAMALSQFRPGRLLGKWRCGSRMDLRQGYRIVCLWLALACLATAAPGEQAGSPTPHAAGVQQGGAAGSSLHDAQDQDPITHHVEEHMVVRRNSERQKTLVADTDKLLALAQQLKADVDKSNQDMLSIDVVKRAEQIEKLARSVKEKMRGN